MTREVAVNGKAAVRMGVLGPEQLLVSLARQLQVPFIRREGLERDVSGTFSLAP